MRSMEETIMFAIMSIVALVGFFLGALVTGYYTTKRADIELKAAWEYAALLEGAVEKLVGALEEERAQSRETFEKIKGEVSRIQGEQKKLGESQQELGESIEDAKKRIPPDYVFEGEPDEYIN